MFKNLVLSEASVKFMGQDKIPLPLHFQFLQWVMITLSTLLSSMILVAAESANIVDRGVQQTEFGKTSDGKSSSVFTCINKKGTTLKLTDFGARIVELKIADHFGRVANITLGLTSARAYEKHDAHFGGIAGRYANRIAKGKFVLDGKTFNLAKNNGPNHLHGGIKGFDGVIWKSKKLILEDGVGVQFDYLSKDGEEGYPGNLQVTVTYILNDNNELKMEYMATTDKPTVVNLTNHAYWNLGGVEGNVLDHSLMVAADHFLPIDQTSIPTGEIKSVKNTAMDFTTARPIGSRIEELKKDPNGTRGYDHNYVLNNQNGSLALAARLQDPKTKRTMEIWTTQPGIQLYVGNFLDGSPINGGHKQHAGVCLETQHYPDSPNQNAFPSVVLRPRETYRQTTIHKFSF